MFSVSPKWYRVYNATSEYFILAESPRHASNAVCDRIFGGARFLIEYATKSAVCSNVGSIVGEFDDERITNDRYYNDVLPVYWYFISYMSYNVSYSIVVLMPFKDMARDYFENTINRRGDCTLIDVRQATKDDVLDDMADKGYLGDLEELDYMELLDDRCFKA